MILCDYKNRHVILNYYYEEELIDRDGISFNEIYVHEGTIYFIKNRKRIVTINSKKYRNILIGEDFQNYYIMRRDKNRLDIYFP
ncbi:hypothetical protein DFO70_10485 [Cytobacillus firmus]|uniref:Uncharacterized protein n=3 Tax=Bacillaceae TaxID=186817 RepID=A0A366JY39_CYTFI|nr:hypothetical protein DFO70_10485 [Cytobacillus firmus]TDX43193.1 hypothetical protein DFO72_10588 [Cytobacillus oceanisediminis]